ncbi:hypothetical protein CABS02_13366 [Colletotrichum abscissum]|uniref:Uncharacterized protein n=1 Tax=Colletotrichum abscissum TaxID=1671311 RepID=A0A9P9X3F0_9PEZI|nr:hypothetical protein CABS02_13366 [Colletotrichum abscissum]
MPQLPQMDKTAGPMPPFPRSHGPMPNGPPMPAATSGHCTACPRLALALVRESLDNQPTRMLSGSALAVAAQDMKSGDAALIGWADVSMCMPKAGRPGDAKTWDRSPTHLMSIALQRGSSAPRSMSLAPPAHACPQPTPQGCPDWASARDALVRASALLRVRQAFRHCVRRTSSIGATNVSNCHGCPEKAFPQLDYFVMEHAGDKEPALR